MHFHSTHNKKPSLDTTVETEFEGAVNTIELQCNVDMYNKYATYTNS